MMRYSHKVRNRAVHPESDIVFVQVCDKRMQDTLEKRLRAPAYILCPELAGS